MKSRIIARGCSRVPHTGMLNAFLASALLLCCGCLSPARIDHIRAVSTNPDKFEIELGQWVLIDGGPCVIYCNPRKEKSWIYVSRLEGSIPASELVVRCSERRYLSDVTGSVIFTNGIMRVSLQHTTFSSDHRHQRWYYNGSYRLPKDPISE